MKMKVDTVQAVKDIANDELFPISGKLKGLAALFFCELRHGREMDEEELNGISAILGGLSSDIRSVYDKLHDIIK